MITKLLPAIVAAVLGCGGAEPRPEDQPLPDPDDPAYAASFDGTMDPRVSTSAGEAGGITVLWPRVVTTEGGVAPEAPEVQAQLRSLVDRVADGRAVEVRPEPERVCPQGGCNGVAVGALLLRGENGCAVVATVSQPGAAPARLVPWAGDVTLRSTMVPFREPPEQHVQIRDFVPCSDLLTALLANEPAVEEAIRQAL